MVDDDTHLKELKYIIKKMLKPLKGIPFSVVIKALSNYEVIPFNPNDKKDKTVLKTLTKVASEAAENINANGICRRRPNEVGNDVEAFVKEALVRYGYEADIPLTLRGRRKASGYPDIEFIDEFGRVNYLECKTYNIETVATTQRSFYISPSDDFKVCHDAHHFVVSFEIFVSGRKGDQNVYKCNNWKLLSLENLSVDVKYEFNSDNLRLYSSELLLVDKECSGLE